jgi:hypothetical protein
MTAKCRSTKCSLTSTIQRTKIRLLYGMTHQSTTSTCGSLIRFSGHHDKRLCKLESNPAKQQLTDTFMMNTAAATLVKRQKGAAALLACGVVSFALVEYQYQYRLRYDDEHADATRNSLHLMIPGTATPACCENKQPPAPNSIDPNPSLRLPMNSTPPPVTSWTRRSLSAIGLTSLPIPRVLTKNDPALRLNSRLLRQRHQDDLALNKLQQQMVPLLQQGDKVAAGAMLKRSFEIIYGANLKPQDRQDFLQRYGCTGWTEDIIAVLLDLAKQRGIVEIGAGHGQWSRVLTDRYKQQQQKEQSSTAPNTKSSKHFDFVLAYDDMSELPLDARIYNDRTQPYHDYFYSQVRKSHSVESVLQQWQCRSRVLLLVFPPPGDMAFNAAISYVDVSPATNDTIVYVGEGRGGANADDAFFDLMESGDWVLVKAMPVQSFGDKGFEKLYVLKRVASVGLTGSDTS